MHFLCLIACNVSGSVATTIRKRSANHAYTRSRHISIAHEISLRNQHQLISVVVATSSAWTVHRHCVSLTCFFSDCYTCIRVIREEIVTHYAALLFQPSQWRIISMTTTPTSELHGKNVVLNDPLPKFSRSNFSHDYLEKYLIEIVKIVQLPSDRKWDVWNWTVPRWISVHYNFDLYFRSHIWNVNTLKKLRASE